MGGNLTTVRDTSKPVNVLSIQSHVAYGHAGNSAAMFPLQRLGIEVWMVPTVVLSNHTGYPTARGGALSTEMIAAVIDGIGERGGFAACDAVLSGYVGDPTLVAVIAETVRRVKAANPDAIYCCDPVMGNDTAGLFVKPAVAEAVAGSLVPLADILTPNRFELSRLADATVESPADAKNAASKLAMPPDGILACTSLRTTSDEIAVLASDPAGSWVVRTPRLKVAANGAGDAFAAILLARKLLGETTDAALSHAVSAVYGVLEATAAAGAEELQLVGAQEVLVNPLRRFIAEAVR